MAATLPPSHIHFHHISSQRYTPSSPTLNQFEISLLPYSPISNIFSLSLMYHPTLSNSRSCHILSYPLLSYRFFYYRIYSVPLLSSPLPSSYLPSTHQHSSPHLHSFVDFSHNMRGILLRLDAQVPPARIMLNWGQRMGGRRSRFDPMTSLNMISALKRASRRYSMDLKQSCNIASLCMT